MLPDDKDSNAETLSVVCSFDHSLLSCIQLTRQANQDGFPTSCWELEDCLESFLGDESVQFGTVSEEVPPLRYLARPDVGWLDCRKPMVSQKETVLGLLEEDVAQPRDVPIQMRVWTASKEETEKVSCHHHCQAPHRLWDRTRLNHVATPPPLPNNEAFALLTPPPPTTVEETAPTARKIDWIDFRAISSFDLSRPSSVLHFLRSILGASLAASPWVNTICDDRAKIATGDCTHLSHSDCVILALPSKAPKELVEFRVSDACPSWSLYSVASVQLPVADGDSPILPWDFVDEKVSTDLQPAELLIYRRLPCRERLSSEHPLTKETAADGCLWQTRILFPMSEDGTEATGDPYYDYRLVASPYINPTVEYPGLLALTAPDNLAIIQREALRIPQWTAWPEQQHYQMKRTGGGEEDDEGVAPWHVFPLCYCFPANDVSRLKWVPLTSGFVPETVALLKKHLGEGLRTALFSRLDPGAVLEAHTGWEDLANHVYRVHLPLQVPAGGLCGTWVDGCVETHETGRLQAFDDSKTHRAFNYSSEDRVVLILDLARPPSLPLGTATGGHSDELDSFIEQMGG